MRPLTELAAARLKRNEGRYLVGRAGGKWTPVRRVTDGVVYDPCGCPDCAGNINRWKYLPEDVASGPPVVENAAFHRNNCLDIAEELADAWNILLLLEQRLNRDGERAVEPWCHQLRTALLVASAALHRLAANVPHDYRQDQYPVERDEAGQ